MFAKTNIINKNFIIIKITIINNIKILLKKR